MNALAASGMSLMGVRCRVVLPWSAAGERRAAWGHEGPRGPWRADGFGCDDGRMRRSWFPFLLVAATTSLVARGARADTFVDDPLTEGSFAGRGSQGGTFDAEGWTTAGGTDAIWYEIGPALPSGKIEFSVRGVSVTDAVTLTGADHDLFAMYQAPAGQPEPIEYSPYFRNNDFKTFLRIFGVQEPDRAGAMKVEFIRCPRGEPWYHDTECALDCGGNQLAYANGNDKDIGWDPAAWYRIGFVWGDGVLSFSRDGAQLGSISYPGTYAAGPLRVRLGSPRHGISDVAFMPSGLTFKDVLVSGTPGEMTPVCGATTPPDAGAPDAGESGDWSAIQDVTAASFVAGVFEDVADLNIEGDGAAPSSVVYIRFPAPMVPVAKATLKLRTHAFGSAAGGSGVVHPVSDTSWSELTMTWQSRPAYGPESVGSPMSVAPDSEIEWDVTALVAAGTVNFAIVSTDGDGAHYLSREAGGASTGPRLVIEAGPEQPPDAGGGAGGPGAAGAGPAGGAGPGGAGQGGDGGSGQEAGQGGAGGAAAGGAGAAGGVGGVGGAAAAGGAAQAGSEGGGAGFGGQSAGEGGAGPASPDGGVAGGKPRLAGSGADEPAGAEDGCACEAAGAGRRSPSWWSLALVLGAMVRGLRGRRVQPARAGVC
jgi:hypothetical protein